MPVKATRFPLFAARVCNLRRADDCGKLLKSLILWLYALVWADEDCLMVQGRRAQQKRRGFSPAFSVLVARGPTDQRE
jgi:hypothetical protein